jgi:hypothetical protein
MSKREQHKVAGRFYGVWYTTDAGHRLYLAHRKYDAIYRDRNAWCIDIYTLERCREQGVKTVGIIAKQNGVRLVWLTDVEDFFGPHSFSHFTHIRQRGLPLPHFRVDPMKSAEIIAKTLRIK